MPPKVKQKVNKKKNLTYYIIGILCALLKS